MNIQIIRCMSCREKIGKMDVDTIHLPLDHKQFLALNEGIKTPFPPDMDPWLWKCPICEMRPYVEQDRWMLDNGYFFIPGKLDLDDGTYVDVKVGPLEVFDPETDLTPPDKQIFTCHTCGKVCASRIGLIGHSRKHKEK